MCVCARVCVCMPRKMGVSREKDSCDQGKDENDWKDEWDGNGLEHGVYR